MHLDYLHPHHYVPIMVLEYFNVSKFEDLPLLFTERLKEDIPYYSENGVLGFTYMHLPMVNWALRTLTQVLYAELIWNPDADVHCILEEYLQSLWSVCGGDEGGVPPVRGGLEVLHKLARVEKQKPFVPAAGLGW